MPMWLRLMSSKRGFTLIELMVTIMLIAVVMGLVVSGLSRGDQDVEQTADRLAATMRFLHDKAATEGSYIKLILDLDEQSYWVESSRDPYLLSRPDDVVQEPVAEASAEKVAEKTDEVKPLKPKEPTFSQVSDFLLKATRLPDGVFFKDVYVEHLQSAAGSGKATIAFFPNGYVEDAVVNLRDGDDKYAYSLKTAPLLGKVDVADGYRDLKVEP